MPQYKNIPKISVLLRNHLVGRDPSSGTPLSGSYRKEAVMELIPLTPISSGATVSHIFMVVLGNPALFVFTVKPIFNS